MRDGFRGWRGGIVEGLALGVALVLGLAGPLVGQDQVGLSVGAVPDAVVIEDLGGGPVDLGEVIGVRPVLIEFWATWCPLCAELQPRLEAAEARYGGEVEFLVVAVAVNQTKRSIERYLAKNSMPGRVLWDTDGRATRAFMAPTTSYVVVFDAEGRVVYTGVGGEQDLERAVGRALSSRDQAPMSNVATSSYASGSDFASYRDIPPALPEHLHSKIGQQ